MFVLVSRTTGGSFMPMVASTTICGSAEIVFISISSVHDDIAKTMVHVNMQVFIIDFISVG